MTPDIWWYAERNQWCGDYTDPRTGKRKRLYLGPHEDRARADYHLQLANVYAGRLPPSDDAQFSALADKCEAWYRVNRTEATARWYRIYWNWVTRFPEPDRSGFGRGELLGDRRCSLISMLDMEAVKAHHIRAGKSARAINSFVTAVKRLGDWGRKMQLISSNPWAELETVPRDAREDPWFPEDAVFHKVHGWLDRFPPAGDYARILFWTGVRVMEPAKARWDGLRRLDRPRGAGMVTLTRHKTGGSTGRARPIYLPSAAMEIIEHQPHHGPTIFAQDDGSPIGYSWLRWHLDQVRDAHPEVARFQFKQSRYRMQSKMVAQGTSPHVTKRVLGHTNVQTQDIYTALPPAAMIEAMERTADLDNEGAVG